MKLPTFAFPHAGGAAHMLRPFASHSAVLELHSLDYPGHGRRIREPLLEDLHSLAADAFDQLRDRTGSPYALFGHSMGARVALLVARLAEQSHRPAPAAIVLAGAPAPGHGDRELLHGLPDGELLGRLKSLGGLPQEVVDEPALRNLVLPILRADMTAVETADLGTWRVSSPLVVLHGQGDEHELADAQAWRDRTRSVCLVEELEGGHFFLHENPRLAAMAMDRQVRRILLAH